MKKQAGHNNYYFMDRNKPSNLMYQDSEAFQQAKGNVQDFKKLQDMNLNHRTNFNNIANQIIECYDLKDKSKSVENKRQNGRIVVNYQVIQPYLQQKVQNKITPKTNNLEPTVEQALMTHYI